MMALHIQHVNHIYSVQYFKLRYFCIKTLALVTHCYKVLPILALKKERDRLYFCVLSLYYLIAVKLITVGQLVVRFLLPLVTAKLTDFY